MTVCETIRHMTRPAILECVATDMGMFKKVKTMHAAHVLGGAMNGVGGDVNIHRSLLDLLKDINGFRVFLMGGEWGGALLEMPGFEGMAGLKSDFRAVVEICSNIIGGYKNGFCDEMENIVPIGVFGLNSDYLVMSGGRVAVLEKEWLSDPDLSVEDMDFWESLDDFFEYLLLNLEGFLGSYWRCLDEDGTQYVVEKVQYL